MSGFDDNQVLISNIYCSSGTKNISRCSITWTEGCSYCTCSYNSYTQLTCSKLSVIRYVQVLFSEYGFYPYL